MVLLLIINGDYVRKQDRVYSILLKTGREISTQDTYRPKNARNRFFTARSFTNACLNDLSILKA